jgi:hypothetical protein
LESGKLISHQKSESGISGVSGISQISGISGVSGFSENCKVLKTEDNMGTTSSTHVADLMHSCTTTVEIDSSIGVKVFNVAIRFFCMCLRLHSSLWDTHKLHSSLWVSHRGNEDPVIVSLIVFHDMIYTIPRGRKGIVSIEFPRSYLSSIVPSNFVVRSELNLSICCCIYSPVMPFPNGT